MQLNYNILWIDDRIRTFIKDGDTKKIEKHIEDLGFNPEITTSEDGNNIDFHGYDLIITDFNLNYINGKSLIEQIRNGNIFTEILFYSENTEITELIKDLYKDRLSFHSGVGINLIEKIKQLIDLSMSKLLELNATRGLITAQTSELDVLMEKICKHLIDIIDDNIINSIFEKNINDTVDYLNKQIHYNNQVKQNKMYPNYINKTNAFNRWRLVLKLIKELLKTKPISDFSIKKFKRYNTEVNEIRNRFAHSIVMNKDGIDCLASHSDDGDIFEYTKENCIELRKKIVDHTNNINSLAQFLKC